MSFPSQPAQTAFEGGHVEVDQKTNGQTGQLQVREHLCLVNRQQMRDSFDLHDDAPLDHEIDALAALQPEPLVDHGNSALTFEADPEQRKLMGQALLVGGLEQPRSEAAMYLDAGADDALRSTWEAALATFRLHPDGVYRSRRPPVASTKRKTPRLPASLFNSKTAKVETRYQRRRRLARARSVST